MNTNNKYFENLDASRFYAFLIVFLSHCFITTSEEIKSSDFFNAAVAWGKIGVLGLEYFFVLSSFLITWIILKETNETKQFSIKNFLARRTLRVWPLYFLIVGLGYIIFEVLNGFGFELNTLPEFQYFGLFIINFYIIENGTNFLFFLAFLWSISIEEQFYLLYSIVIKYIRPNILWLSVFLIALSLVFRIYFVNNDRQLYFHLISALGNFGIGGITAYVMFYNNSIFSKLTQLSKSFNLVFYAILVLSIVFYHQLYEFQWFKPFSRLFYSILFGYLIIEQTKGQNRLFNLGNSKRISYFGKISYGLYCFHGIVITILLKLIEQINIKENLLIVFLLYPVIILLLSLFTSHISYKYYEEYFLKLKRHFYTFTK